MASSSNQVRCALEGCCCCQREPERRMLNTTACQACVSLAIFVFKVFDSLMPAKYDQIIVDGLGSRNGPGDENYELYASVVAQAGYAVDVKTFLARLDRSKVIVSAFKRRVFGAVNLPTYRSAVKYSAQDMANVLYYATKQNELPGYREILVRFFRVCGVGHIVEASEGLPNHDELAMALCKVARYDGQRLSFEDLNEDEVEIAREIAELNARRLQLQKQAEEIAGRRKNEVKNEVKEKKQMVDHLKKRKRDAIEHFTALLDDEEFDADKAKSAFLRYKLKKESLEFAENEHKLAVGKAMTFGVFAEPRFPSIRAPKRQRNNGRIVVRRRRGGVMLQTQVFKLAEALIRLRREGNLPTTAMDKHAFATVFKNHRPEDVEERNNKLLVCGAVLKGSANRIWGILRDACLNENDPFKKHLAENAIGIKQYKKANFGGRDASKCPKLYAFQDIITID